MIRLFNRFTRIKPNFNFGKVSLVLILILLIQVFVIQVPVSEASEPLYYYDKYIATKNYSPWSGEVTTEVAGWPPNTYRIEFGGGDRGVQWDGQKYYWSVFEPSTTSYNGWRFYNGELMSYMAYGQGYAPYKEFFYTRYRTITGYTKSTFQSQVIGLLNEYPTDGVHTDGYWYIRKGLVNNNPQINITLPNANSYFGKYTVA